MNKVLLSCDIKQIEQEILQRKNDIAVNILEIGDRLIIAKEILKHGEWGAWLEHNVMFTDRTARNYMKAARAFPEEKRKSISDLNGTKILLLSELPDNTRDEFIDEIDGETLRKMSTKDLKEAIRTEKAGADIMAHFAVTNEEGYQTFMIAVDRLKPSPYYNKYITDVIGIRKGAEYIKWLGHIDKMHKKKWLSPITITKDNVIIDGHETVRAFMDLGITEINAHYAVCNESNLKSTFAETLELVFLSYQMWGYTRTSAFYYFSALYHFCKGEQEEGDRMMKILQEKGDEIDDKYAEWMGGLKNQLGKLEGYAGSVQNLSAEKKKEPLPTDIKALCNDIYNKITTYENEMMGVGGR